MKSSRARETAPAATASPISGSPLGPSTGGELDTRIGFHREITASELVGQVEVALEDAQVTRAEVAGFEGWVVHGLVAEPLKLPAGNERGSAVSLFQAETGEQVRYHLFDTQTEAAVIVVAGEPSEFSRMIDSAERLVSSIWVDSTESQGSC